MGQSQWLDARYLLIFLKKVMTKRSDFKNKWLTKNMMVKLIQMLESFLIIDCFVVGYYRFSS